MSFEAEKAENSLRELGSLTGRTRLASRSMATGLPMIGWGAAWILGLGALDLLAGTARILVVALAWAVGMALSWLPIRSVIRTGAETRLRLAWVIVLVASPFLVAAAQPASFTHAVLLVSALWGLAMCLYSIATHDRVLAAVTGSGVVLAGTLASIDIASRLLWFGLSAGIPLVMLGALRVRNGVNRV